MEKIVLIDGKEVKMRITARTLPEYREAFGKDLLSELNRCSDGITTGTADYSVFENLAWLMAKKAGEEVHADLPPKQAVEEWLDEFDSVLAIVNAIPDIMELWGMANETTSRARKK